MKRGLLVIGFGILLSYAPLSGRGASAGQETATSPKTTSDGENAHGIYVSGVEVLNGDRNGKDLEGYPIGILTRVREKWYRQVPMLQSAGRKPGITIVELEIANDGTLGKVRTVESSGDSSLDAGASEAILSSAPFGKLPEAYPEKTLNLRMHFGYDQPVSATTPFCNGPNWGAHPPKDGALHQVGKGVKPPNPKFTPDPQYSEQARKAKYMSVVWIAGTVDQQGAFTDLCLTQAAGNGLDEKAMEAVRTWKFDPATLDGQPVPVRILVQAEFQLY